MIKNLLFIPLFALLLTSLSCQQSKTSEKDEQFEQIDSIFSSVKDHRGVLPFHVSNTFSDLDEPSCYQIQKMLVQEFYPPEAIAGYKAAVTSESAMSLLKTDHPASGYLLKEGWVSIGDTILSAAFSSPFIEIELGYYLKESISTPIQDPAQLKELVSGIVPVIELPDLGFPDREDWTLANFIVHNSASKQFISGALKAPQVVGGINSLVFTMVKDGVILGEAKASDALGDQWKALQWLINHRIEQGDEIGPQHLLITGSLGQLYPLDPGQYEVSYAELGKLNFVIR